MPHKATIQNQLDSGAVEVTDYDPIIMHACPFGTGFFVRFNDEDQGGIMLIEAGGLAFGSVAGVIMGAIIGHYLIKLFHCDTLDDCDSK